MVAVLKIGEFSLGDFAYELAFQIGLMGYASYHRLWCSSHEPEEEDTVDTVKTSWLSSSYPNHAIDIIGGPLQYSCARRE